MSPSPPIETLRQGRRAGTPAAVHRIWRNPWLGALLALAVLGLYARIETPLAALALGLPFAVVGWTYWCLMPRLLASKAPMTAPVRVFPPALAVVIALLALAWFAYMVYGLITGQGVIGWLNAVQATRDGRFSVKLSFIVALLDLFCAMAVLGLLGSRLARTSGAGSPAAPAVAVAPLPLRALVEPLRNPARVALWMLAALAVAPWVIGYPVHLWMAAAHRADAQAHYAPIVLEASPPAWPPQAHVALTGMPQREHVLVLKEGQQARKTYFVPVTGPDWTGAQAVNVVLTFDAEVAPRLDRPILGRLRSDNLPIAAIDAFRRSGVTIAPGHRLIDLVPSEHGQVPDRSAEDLQEFLLLATFLSVTSLLGALMFVGVMRLRRRKARVR